MDRKPPILELLKVVPLGLGPAFIQPPPILINSPLGQGPTYDNATFHDDGQQLTATIAQESGTTTLVFEGITGGVSPIDSLAQFEQAIQMATGGSGHEGG